MVWRLSSYMIIIFLGSSGMHGITNKLTLGKGHHFFQSFGWQAHGVPAPRPCGTPKQCPWAARLFQALPLHWCSAAPPACLACMVPLRLGLQLVSSFTAKRQLIGGLACQTGHNGAFCAVAASGCWHVACVGGAHRHLHCGLQPKTAGQAPYQAHPHFPAFFEKRPGFFGLCGP